jgi:hypothetical protein
MPTTLTIYNKNKKPKHGRSHTRRIIPRIQSEYFCNDIKYITSFNSASLFGANNANNSYVISPLGIAQGTDIIANRIGRRISLLRLDMTYTVDTSSTTAITNPSLSRDSGFAYVILDRFPNGSTAAFSDVFDGTNVIGAHALTNIYENPDRFQILKRQPWCYVAGQQSNGMYTVAINLKQVLGSDNEVQYSGTGSNVAYVQKNNILIAFVSSNYNLVSTPTTSLLVNYRFEYLDL